MRLALAAMVAGTALLGGAALADRPMGQKVAAVRQRIRTAAEGVKLGLRKLVAERRIAGARRELARMGLDAPAKLVVTSRMGTTGLLASLVREEQLLRGADPGSRAGARRQRVQQKIAELTHARERLGHRAAATILEGTGEIEVSVDFETKRNQLVNLLAHELRHVKELRPVGRLLRRAEALRRDPEATRETLVEADALQREAERQMARGQADGAYEARGYRTGAFALGRAGRRLEGEHLRGGFASDVQNPQGLISEAIIGGYLEGAAETLSTRGSLSARAQAYLEGYRSVLVEQARASLASGQLDPHAPTPKLGDRLSQALEPVDTPAAAHEAGRRDAQLGRSPTARARALR